MTRRRRRIWPALIFGALLIFLGLGVLRQKLPETAEQLPVALVQIADASSDFLSRVSHTVRPTDEENEEQPWNLTLVNGSNPVPKDWESAYTKLWNDPKIDTRIYSALQKMFDDCRAAGLLPIVYRGYRSIEEQRALFDGKVREYLDQGYSREEAEALTGKWAAHPGYSEHQLGLAADIDSEDSSRCSDQAVWDWMAAHCQDYGFILRYPEEKTEITGTQYEPWHFRYVGEQAAKEIMEQGITLEEYLKR